MRLPGSDPDLPPRMRGSLAVLHLADLVRGSTPAYAGIPQVVQELARGRTVYPRVCGDPVLRAEDAELARGLPPRMRGSRRKTAQGLHGCWSTPAYAGIPCAGAPARSRDPVYPRVCGDPSRSARLASRILGLPPRMRGSRGGGVPSRAARRSTPAYAGIPGSSQRNPRPRMVYPRVCGDPGRGALPCRGVDGLPPRMRGSRRRLAHAGRGRGSTPAYAGIPRAATTCSHQGSVYPRVCGDPRLVGAIPRHPAGLPPRMRGSHGRSRHHQRGRGSTPAYAGIPDRSDG